VQRLSSRSEVAAILRRLRVATAVEEPYATGRGGAQRLAW
jgi:hypothetical protein